MVSRWVVRTVSKEVAESAEARDEENVFESEGAAHIAGAFDRTLMRLTKMTAELADAAERRLGEGFVLFQENDEAKLRAFREEDQALNNLSHEISDTVVRTMAMRQPMAQDLRLLVSLFRIARDLERVADCSVSLTRRGRHLQRPLSADLTAAIGTMTQATARLLRAVMEDYQNGTELILAQAEEEDEKINLLFRDFMELLRKENEAGNCSVDDVMRWFSVARVLERAGDHIVHVADAIYFFRHGQYAAETEED